MHGDDWEAKAKQRPAIMLNAMHSARELTSLAEIEYLMMRLLFQYVKKDAETLEILRNSVIVFIPVVNVDGYEQIYKHWSNTRNMTELNKNRHVYHN